VGNYPNLLGAVPSAPTLAPRHCQCIGQMMKILFTVTTYKLSQNVTILYISIRKMAPHYTSRPSASVLIMIEFCVGFISIVPASTALCASVARRRVWHRNIAKLLPKKMCRTTRRKWTLMAQYSTTFEAKLIRSMRLVMSTADRNRKYADVSPLCG